MCKLSKASQEQPTAKPLTRKHDAEPEKSEANQDISEQQAAETSKLSSHSTQESSALTNVQTVRHPSALQIPGTNVGTHPRTS